MKCKECLHCNVCAFVKGIKADKAVLQTNFKCPDYIDKNLYTPKSEAIKEFVERLKRTSIGLEIGDDKKLKMTVVSTAAIDNLVKEMTEG